MSVLFNLLPPNSYPYKGSVREQMRYLLGFARRVPSFEGSQPWRFRINDEGVEVHVDRSRLPISVDPDGRGALLSIGSCLHHLMIAMRCHRLEPLLSYVSNGFSDPGHVATIQVVGSAHPTREEVDLFSEMIRGDRSSSERLIGEDSLMKMRRAMVAPRTGLIFVDGDWITSLVTDIEEDPENALSQPALAQKDDVFPKSRKGPMGLSRSLDKPSETMRLALGFLKIHAYGLDHRLTDTLGGVESPANALIYSEGDLRNDVLDAGRSLGRLSLVAHQLGLKIYPRYDLWDVPGLADTIRNESALPGYPQIVLRIVSDGTQLASSDTHSSLWHEKEVDARLSLSEGGAMIRRDPFSLTTRG
ncbi:MAG: hypothetical protein ACO1SV_24555 [Fimbriimonas sp.]